MKETGEVDGARSGTGEIQHELGTPGGARKQERALKDRALLKEHICRPEGELHDQRWNKLSNKINPTLDYNH